MLAAFKGSRRLWRPLTSGAEIALIWMAIGCGGNSDVTAPIGGGGNNGGGTTPVATVGVTSASTSLLVGVTDSVALGTTALTATTNDANGYALTGRTVTWSSGTTSVATVSPAGLVTAVGAGTATITATSEGKTGQVSVTVTRPAVSTVTVAPSTVTLLVGVADSTNLGATTLTAISKDASGHQLSGRATTWSSSDATVATVSSTGAAKAGSAGSATISATIEGQSGSVALTVIKPAVAQVSVVPQASSVKVGAVETLAVTLLDSQSHLLSGRLIATFNNSPSIISVHQGQITGIAAGTGTVNFSSENVTTVATITVTP